MDYFWQLSEFSIPLQQNSKMKADTVMKEYSSEMKHFRNSYITYSELTTFIVASVCNVLILQANTFIDAVIVGNFVSTDAMAVVNLLSPLLSVIVMVPALLAEGAMVAGSRALGQQDYEQVNRAFMVNLAGGLFFALALALTVSYCACMVPTASSWSACSCRCFPSVRW